MAASGRLKSAAVIAATNIPVHTFNRWLDRKVIDLAPEDTPGDGRGRPRGFGKRTIIKLAIAHKASLLGIPANIAVTLATKFTDVPQHGRPIGGLFPIGSTYIVATPDGNASVVNVKPEEDVGSLLQDATLILNVNAIISKINFDIGVPK